MSNATVFKYNLNKEEKSKIIDFYNSFSFISINQFPDWERINNPEKKVCYFIDYENTKIKSYCVILENRKIAYINFGPISKSENDIINAIDKIIRYYKNKNIYKVVVKLGVIDKTICQTVQKSIKPKYKEGNYPFNWSTLILDLKIKSIDDIFSKFSKNHKRSIKKAKKNNIKVSKMNQINEIENLADIYDKMYKTRKIVSSFKDSRKVFANILKFFNENNNGFILGVYNTDNQLIGGLILPVQGKTMYYQYGVASVEHRNIPILHIGFFEAIKLAIKNNLEYFDFGGYIPNVKNTHQIYNINKFKDGFRGKILYYSKNMHFILKPLRFFIYDKIRIIYLKLFR